MDFACKKKEKCLKCGQCCHIREPAGFSFDEEDLIKRKLFAKIGVVYLYPFDRFTISISDEEKKVMEDKAKELKIELKLLPKAIFVGKDSNALVLNWFIDQDVCPFFQEKQCLIYPNRPMICQSFPEKYEFSFDRTLQRSGLSYEEALKSAERFLI